jgi:hypothetical protein
MDRLKAKYDKYSRTSAVYRQQLFTQPSRGPTGDTDSAFLANFLTFQLATAAGCETGMVEKVREFA